MVYIDYKPGIYELIDDEYVVKTTDNLILVSRIVDDETLEKQIVFQYKNIGGIDKEISYFLIRDPKVFKRFFGVDININEIRKMFEDYILTHYVQLNQDDPITLVRNVSDVNTYLSKIDKYKLSHYSVFTFEDDASIYHDFTIYDDHIVGNTDFLFLQDLFEEYIGGKVLYFRV